MKGKFPTISLFSGAMGLDLGLEFSGFDTRVFVEIDNSCRKTISANIMKLEKQSITVFNDILETSSEKLLSAFNNGSKDDEVFLIAGGPPCQAFSTAGKRKSLNDPRGNLVHKYFELIEDIQPRFFVFENVRGILSAAIKHRPLSERGKGYPQLTDEEELGSLLNLVILPRFKELGYDVVHGLVNAADYGTPQTRERVLFIGSRDSEFEKNGVNNLTDLMPPTHSSDGTNGLPLWRTIGDVFQELQGAPEYSSYSHARREVYEIIPEGKNWRYIRDNYPEDYLKQVMGGAFSSSGGKVGFWRRLSYSKPAPTLTTSPLQKSTGLCHPEFDRPLSVQEYARIQEFPDWWEFQGSTTSKYRQIGNAVPVGLAKAIGKGLTRIIQGGNHDS